MRYDRKVRDNTLIDALEALAPERFEDEVWRVVREGRDPMRGSGSGGRWDDGTFEVLYTAHERDGAVMEMYFHLMRGQPILPSKMNFLLYGLRVKLGRALKLIDLAALGILGVDVTNYGAMEYGRHREEYRRTQEIAEAAHFLDFDGLIVPNARWKCQNVILFTDRVPPDALNISHQDGPIDWVDWKRKVGVT